MTRPDQIPEAWNAASEAYDQKIWDFMTPWVAQMIERADPNDEDEMLDVAAGSGALTVALAPRAKRVLAVDFAEEMLEILQRRAHDAGVENLESAVMDGQALALPDESFDTVCSNFGVMFFPDRVKGFSEMHRVLRAGGKAVISAPSAPERFQIIGSFLGAVREALPQMPKPPGPPPIFSLADPSRLESELRAGGFEHVEVETLSNTIEFDNVDRLWDIYTSATPPTVALLKRVGSEKASAIRSTLAEQMQRRFGDGPVRLSNEVNIGVAVR